MVRRLLTSFGVLAILVAPSIGDFLTRGDACTVAPCCIGKMSRSCPMHPSSSPRGAGMRACSANDGVAVTHHTAVTLSAPRRTERVVVAEAIAPRITESRIPPDPLPPDPPPPRRLC